MRQDTARTRKSLLAAASEIFAEKGYRDATIAEISERAGTNIAAVNYHFGDKETLYRESWREAFRDSIAAHPPDGGIPSTAPARERLRGQIAALVRRVNDRENNREFRIAHKELANPTGLLEEVGRTEISPIREKMEASLREILGRNATIDQIRYCAISIISQCIIPAFIKASEKTPEWMVEDIEGYLEHIVTFSAAGVKAVRNSGRKRQGSAG